MSKQLRIWLFVLLGTLLTSTTLPAQGVITMTTSKRVGDRIELYIKANGRVTIEGAQETGQTNEYGYEYYAITSQTVTIRGDVTTLKCYTNQLTSLNGSGCTALTSLSCSFNQLTSLDVSGCTALTELNCVGNKLTSLNLSGCTALTKLSCWNNKLTSLNVSGCSALTQLYCEDNHLTSLDVSGCTALTELNCSYNQLTSLDVSGCTALTELNCSYNQLTSLDVSGCTALTELDCRRNSLTSLDLSGCTALTTLKCWNNKLTSLDLSKNSALATIDCSDNKLPSLDLSGHKALTALNCSENLLRKIDLSGCTSIILLTCHRNQIKAPEMANLVNSLPDLQGKGVGLFKVFYDGSGEGNVCLAAHVATAQAKGWKTQFTRSYFDDAWYDYTGADNALYAVSSWSTFGGSISFTGADNLNAVPYGTELTVVATPAYGYKLTKLTANGKDILATKKFVVTENTEIKATFAKKKNYTVTFTPKGEGENKLTATRNGEPFTSGSQAQVDDKIVITAQPAEGYQIDKWLIGKEEMEFTPYTGKTTFECTVGTADVLIKATFTKKTFAVTLTKEGEGTITATGAADLTAVPYGTELTINATPAEGYKLTALTANGQDILATKKVVIKGATEVKATFADNTGVETTVTQQVQLYPNPATDHLVVEGVAPASEVTLHSMTGERLYAGRADDRGVLQIDLTPYADGVYLVCVAGETYRVVIRR